MSKGSIIKVKVSEIRQETPLIKSFKLVPFEQDLLPPFSGGAHITTFIPFHQQRIERNYSLCSNPATRDYYKIAVRLTDNSLGGSNFWHNQVKIGDVVDITPPKNHFPLSHRARHHVFIAGGIGITPFLAMMEDVTTKKQSFELHYAARSRDLCAFYDQIQSQFPSSRFYFSEEGAKNKLSPKVLRNQNVGTHVYICGPSSMIQEYSIRAKSFGYSKNSIHFEQFNPPIQENNRPFYVKLNKSQRVIPVTENEDLLTALLNANVNVRYACRVGRCGTCKIRVLNGQIEHRDSYLEDNEKQLHNVVISCVSRAKLEGFVLDL
jgi:ferredoxin-NADP reductase